MFLPKKANKTKKVWDQQCILEQNSAVSLSIDDHHSRRAERVLLLVSLLTMLFVFAELVGGYLAHSLAVITDAFHMLSDLSSFLVSILALRLSRRPATSRHSFGFQRAEVLGALSSILVIWILTGVLLYMAILRIIERAYEVEPDTMMITAGIGVLFNVVIGAMLHFAGGKIMHAHGHAHSSSSKISDAGTEESSTTSEDTTTAATTDHPHRSKNLNIRAAFVHVLGDLVQSLGVLIAAVIIKFTGFSIADPICTFLFSILVLFTTVPVFGDTLIILMEASPHQVDHQKLYTDLITLPGVIGVHSLRVWSLKTDTFAATVHLELATTTTEEKGACLADSVVAMAQQKLVSKHQIRFVTVQTHCQLKDTDEQQQQQRTTTVVEEVSEEEERTQEEGANDYGGEGER